MGFLKWIFASSEMRELERWRVHYEEARRWLAEFPDAVNALEYVKDNAKGFGADIHMLREAMRVQRGKRSEEFGVKIEKIVVKPGDTLTVMVKENLDDQQRGIMAKQLALVFGDKVKFCVCDGGVTLQVANTKADAHQLSIGDVVCPKWGGLPMTVEFVRHESQDRYPTYHCAWFVGAEIRRGIFSGEDIEAAGHSDPAAKPRSSALYLGDLVRHTLGGPAMRIIAATEKRKEPSIAEGVGPLIDADRFKIEFFATCESVGENGRCSADFPVSHLERARQ